MPIKWVSIPIAVLLIAVLLIVMLPARVSITSEGMLSVEMVRHAYASPAFPVVAAVNGGNRNIDDTNHPANLPAGIEAGDLLLVFFACDGGFATITFPEGWTELSQTANGFHVTFGTWYRVADGEEGATVSVTTSGAERSAHNSYRITGYSGTPEIAIATGVTANPNPPSLTPTWGAKDTLWLAAQGNDYNRTVTAYPSDYTDGRNDRCTHAAGCGVGSARREVNAVSEDPGTFTISVGDQWVANTVAIQPVEAEADISNLPTSKVFGNVFESSSHWSNGSAPAWPLDDGECYFTVTNNGDTCSITIKATNFTGGDGWTLTSGSPGSGTVRLRAGKSGDANEGTMVILTTEEQAFIAGLVTSKKWELKLETGTFTDYVLKTSIATLTATLD